MKSPNPSSDLTVLVFKDNSAARTFRVPIGWISKLGLFTGLIAAVAVLGIFLSLKYYITARSALKTVDPTYVQDLEQEVATLRAVKNSTPAAATAPTTSANSTTTAAPAPTVTVTVTPTAAQAAAQPGSNLSFSALPASVQAPPPVSEIAIGINEPNVAWRGRTLSVKFFIQYVKEDKGSQQGRIVLLARGPDTVIAYPVGVLNPSESKSLISPEKGEYFSVSRIREVKAEFGPMKSPSALQSVEVFLFSNQGGLLIHQVLIPGTGNPEKKNDEKEDS